MKAVLMTLAAAGACALAGAANAQATRTWVSGVGDDANPCSRTAPCKTFAGSISKTATGGEIDCLDPGGFGALTITKSIMIKCDGVEGGVLVSGTNGMTITDSGAGTAVVYLSGLDFEGIGTGLNGISILSAANVTIVNSVIRGFITAGISDTSSTASKLVIENTIVTDNAGAGGVLVKPNGAVVVIAAVKNSHMDRNLYGLRVEDGGQVTATNSTAANNTNNGYIAVATTTAAEMNVVDSIAIGNGAFGVVTSGAGGAKIRIQNVTIADNATGISTAGGGTVFSYTPASNANVGNGTPGAPNGAAIPLQ